MAFAHAGSRLRATTCACRHARGAERRRLRARRRSSASSRTASGADTLVVSARIAGGDADRDGIGLFLVDRGRTGTVDARAADARRHARGRRRVRRRSRIARCRASATPGSALPLIEDVVDFATALSAPRPQARSATANDATLDYLKTRKQFGVPIGSVPGAAAPDGRSRDRARAGEVDGEPRLRGRRFRSRIPQRRARIVSAAKVRIADACRRVSQESIQLHGGMGMSDELKVSHTFRRLTAIAQQFGDADHHLARFAALDRLPTEQMTEPRR